MFKLSAVSLFVAVCVPPVAFAAQSDQEILLAPAESTTVASEATTAPLGQRISFGVGSGVNTFTGNIGKIYSSSSPVLELRGEWAFNSLFVGRVGADLASYSFDAQPNGAVKVNTQSLQAAGQVHYLSTALASSGFDPYATVGGSAVFRKQTFETDGMIAKDNAVALNAGLGTNYLLSGGKFGVWCEGLVSQVYFADRHEQMYLKSGVDDMTGLLYAARFGVKYYF